MGFLKRALGRGQSKTIPDTRALDALTIHELAKAGADLRVPRETLHYLYVPTEQAGQQALQALTAEDRTIAIRPAAKGPGWLVLLTQSMIVDADSIASIRTEIEAVCGRLHGEYDGWEAAVTPD